MPLVFGLVLGLVFGALWGVLATCLGVAVGCRIRRDGRIRKDSLEEADELLGSLERHPAGRQLRSVDKFPF